MTELNNPSNGNKVVVRNWKVILGSILFGQISFLCIGKTGHALANFAVELFLWSFFLGFIVWIGYEFVSPQIVSETWLKHL
tara:strand:- start:588 stop:830 length:243 start_codon:yes stop_codon:yes gene_type:complete